MREVTPGVPQFAGDHPARDNADDLAPCRQRCVGENAHQPDVPAAIDDRQPALGQDRAAVPGRRGIFRQRAWAGTAVDADPLH